MIIEEQSETNPNQIWLERIYSKDKFERIKSLLDLKEEISRDNLVDFFHAEAAGLLNEKDTDV